MAHIGTELRTWMVAQSDITDQVLTRIYADVLPQNATLPACTYEVISMSSEHDTATGDADYSHARIQVSCYADTSIAAQDAAYAIRKTAGLQGYLGTFSTVTVGKVTVEDSLTLETESPTEGSDEHRYIAITDYRISFTDT